MGKSKKKPIIKDKGPLKKGYWSVIRSRWNQISRAFKNFTGEEYYYSDSPDLYSKDEQHLEWFSKEEYLEDKYPNPKTIINDYDYCDYKFILKENDEQYKNASRK